MNWISVKDRLPGINSSKLYVKDSNNNPQEAYFIGCKDSYYFCIGQGTRQTFEPSFWIPSYIFESFYNRNINEKIKIVSM